MIIDVLICNTITSMSAVWTLTLEQSNTFYAFKVCRQIFCKSRAQSTGFLPHVESMIVVRINYFSKFPPSLEMSI